MSAKKPSLKGVSLVLTPNKEAVIVDGKLFYSEGHQAWNILRLKKEILHEFPQLRDKTDKFGYKMVVHKNHEEARKALKEIDENSVPILLYLCRKE